MVNWEERRPVNIFVNRYNEVGKQVSPSEDRFTRRKTKREAPYEEQKEDRSIKRFKRTRKKSLQI
jgi:hypothetical protein